MMIRLNLIGNTLAVATMLILLTGCDPELADTKVEASRNSILNNPEKSQDVSATGKTGITEEVGSEQELDRESKPERGDAEAVDESGGKPKVVVLDESQRELFKQRKQLLFFVHRTKNKNIVMYECFGDATSVTGLKVRWKNLATNNKIERLSFLDRTAYGATLSADKKMLTVSSLRKIEQPPSLSLKFDEALNRWTVRTSINGVDARLLRIWIEHSDNLIPTVYWLDLYGVDANGNGVTERYDVNEKPE